MPGLVQVVGLIVSVPPSALSVPLLMKVAGLIEYDCPAVSALMVPALTMVPPPQFWFRLP